MDGATLTAKAGAGDNVRDVFTVTLDPGANKYTFTLKDTLDHTDSTPFPLDFSYTVTDGDGDGDTTDGAFTVTVNDDVPMAGNDSVTLASADKVNLVIVLDASSSMFVPTGASGDGTVLLPIDNQTNFMTLAKAGHRRSDPRLRVFPGAGDDGQVWHQCRGSAV